MSYTIKSGDTLGAIAQRYGTTVQALASANGISDPNKIRAGMTLSIPAASSNISSDGMALQSTNTPPSKPSISSLGISAPVQKAPAGQSAGSYKGVPIQAGTDAQIQAQIDAIDGKGASGGSGAGVAATGQGGANSGAPQGGSTPLMINGVAIPGGTVGPDGNPVFDTGNKNLDGLMGQLYGVVKNNLNIGNVVNPALQITPDLVNQFLTEAHGQVDPYYQQVMKDNIDSINSSLKSLGTQYGNEVGNRTAQFQGDLAVARNAAGNNGVAFSGTRQLAENNLAAGANRDLSSLGASYGEAIGSKLRTGAAAVGSGIPGLDGGLSSFQLPSLAGARVGLEGGDRGNVGSGPALDFTYNPDNYKVGSVGSNYGSALTSSSNQFLNSYLQSAGNNSARTFMDLNGVPTIK